MLCQIIHSQSLKHDRTLLWLQRNDGLKLRNRRDHVGLVACVALKTSLQSYAANMTSHKISIYTMSILRITKLMWLHCRTKFQLSNDTTIYKHAWTIVRRRCDWTASSGPHTNIWTQLNSTQLKQASTIKNIPSFNTFFASPKKSAAHDWLPYPLELKGSYASLIMFKRRWLKGCNKDGLHHNGPCCLCKVIFILITADASVYATDNYVMFIVVMHPRFCMLVRITDTQQWRRRWCAMI